MKLAEDLVQGRFEDRYSGLLRKKQLDLVIGFGLLKADKPGLCCALNTIIGSGKFG